MLKYLPVLLIILISGCCTGGVSNPNVQYPIINIPVLPVLPIISEDDLSPLNDQIIRKLLESDTKQKDHIKRIRASVDTYNNWAKNQNTK